MSMLEQYKASLAQCFEQQVEKTPSAVACMEGAIHLSYEELNQRANQLAAYLKQQGFVSYTVVAIWGKRSIRTIVSMLAILKAGGAYVWLDPSNPFVRQEKILKDLQAAFILSVEDQKLSLPKTAAKLLFLEDTYADLSQYSKDNPELNGNNERLGMIIYQSDPIGQPVGVMIEQRSIIHLVLDQPYLTYQPTHCMFHLCEVGEESSLFEIWGALLNGIRLIIVEEEAKQHPRQKGEIFKEHREGIALLSMYQFKKMTQKAPDLFENFDYVLLRGEEWDPNSMDSIQKPHHLLLVWGVLESPLFSSYREIKEEKDFSSSLGTNLQDTITLLLDEQLMPITDEKQGMIYIGGKGIARGYWKQLALTKERFIQKDPLRLYRTECIGKRLSDETITCVGRKDNTLMLEGHVVAAKEIESGLEAAPDVEKAIVLVEENQKKEKKLVVFLTPNKKLVRIHYQGTCEIKWSDESVETVKVRDISKGGMCLVGISRKIVYKERLIMLLREIMGDKEILAEALWQSDKTIGIRFLNEVPLIEGYIDQYFKGKCEVLSQRRNYGKLLETKLPAYMVPTYSIVLSNWPMDKEGKLDKTQLHEFYIAEEARGLSTKERNDARAWKEEITAQIKGEYYVSKEGENVTRLSDKIMQKLRENYFVLGDRDLFANGMLSQLTLMIAKSIEKAQRDPIFSVSRNKDAPLSSWQMEHISSGNIAIRGFLKGDLAWHPFYRAVTALCERHEMLHTRYDQKKKKYYQRVIAKYEVDCQMFGLDQDYTPFLTQAFSLTTGPLFRGAILQIDENESDVLLVCHQSIVDFRSLQIIIRDLMALYREKAEGKKAELPELPIQYVDYATWLEVQLSERSFIENAKIYWEKQFEVEKPALTLPYDFSPPFQKGGMGEVSFTIPPGLTSALKGYCINMQSTLNMLLLAALFSFLNKKSKATDLLITVTVPNRDRLEIENVVGRFENNLPLRLNLKEKIPFKKLVEGVRSALMELYLYQEMPVNEIISDPLSKVLFSYGQAEHFQENYFSDSFYDFIVVIREKTNTLEGCFRYSTACFKEETMSAWADQWIYILQQISANHNIKFDDFLLEQEQELILRATM